MEYVKVSINSGWNIIPRQDTSPQELSVYKRTCCKKYTREAYNRARKGEVSVCKQGSIPPLPGDLCCMLYVL